MRQPERFNLLQIRLLKYRQALLRAAGFTFVELLTALGMSFIIIMVLFSSLSTVNGLVHKSQVEMERRIELSRAFDFMTREIQSAVRINHTDTLAADGGGTTLDNVVASAGLTTAQLGSYGDLVLYLEVPFSSPAPSICPVGTPMAGSPPASTDVDRVVYDVRANTPSWLGPRLIMRYGRIPDLDGIIDPCTNPVGSDVLVDSITDTAPSPAPTCPAPANLSGGGGFWACVNSGLVDLYLSSQVTSLENRSITSKAFSYSSSGGTLVAPVLTGTRIPGNQMTLNWSWSGSGTVSYVLNQAVNSGIETTIYQGNLTSVDAMLGGVVGSESCFSVTAKVGTHTSVTSNIVCETK